MFVVEVLFWDFFCHHKLVLSLRASEYTHKVSSPSGKFSSQNAFKETSYHSQWGWFLRQTCFHRQRHHCRMPVGCRDSASSIPQGATNDAYPAPLPEGQLLQMIAEMKARMKEWQARVGGSRSRECQEGPWAGRPWPRKCFRAREALEQTNEQLHVQITTLQDSQKRQRSFP